MLLCFLAYTLRACFWSTAMHSSLYNLNCIQETANHLLTDWARVCSFHIVYGWSCQYCFEPILCLYSTTLSPRWMYSCVHSLVCARSLILRLKISHCVLSITSLLEYFLAFISHRLDGNFDIQFMQSLYFQTLSLVSLIGNSTRSYGSCPLANQ